MRSEVINLLAANAPDGLKRKVVVSREAGVSPICWVCLPPSPNLTYYIGTHFETPPALRLHLDIGFGAIEKMARIDAVLGLTDVAPKQDWFFF